MTELVDERDVAAILERIANDLRDEANHPDPEHQHEYLSDLAQETDELTSHLRDLDRMRREPGWKPEWVLPEFVKDTPPLRLV